MRELLEIERIAREILAQDRGGWVGECDAECDHDIECGETVTGEVTCPQCKTVVPFSAECQGEQECGAECGSEVSLEFEDPHNLFRALELALVQLDLAREREKSTPAVKPAQNEEAA